MQLNFGVRWPHVPGAHPPALLVLASSRLRRWALAGLVVEYLALFRCLGEPFRLRAVQGPALTVATVLPFVAGAAIAAAGAAWSTAALLRDRAALALGGSVATVVALLLYRLLAM